MIHQSDRCGRGAPSQPRPRSAWTLAQASNGNGSVRRSTEGSGRWGPGSACHRSIPAHSPAMSIDLHEIEGSRPGTTAGAAGRNVSSVWLGLCHADDHGSAARKFRGVSAKRSQSGQVGRRLIAGPTAPIRPGVPEKVVSTERPLSGSLIVLRNGNRGRCAARPLFGLSGPMADWRLRSGRRKEPDIHAWRVQ